MSGRSTGPGHRSACTCGSLKIHGSWRNVPCVDGHLQLQINFSIIFSPLHSYVYSNIVNSPLVLLLLCWLCRLSLYCQLALVLLFWLCRHSLYCQLALVLLCRLSLYCQLTLVLLCAGCAGSFEFMLQIIIIICTQTIYARMYNDNMYGNIYSPLGCGVACVIVAALPVNSSSSSSHVQMMSRMQSSIFLYIQLTLRGL